MVLGVTVLIANAILLRVQYLASHFIDEEVVAVAVRFGYWLIPVLLFGSVAYVYDGFFLGLTKGRVLPNSMLFSTILIFGPVAWVAAARGVNDILWMAMTLWMVSRAATLGWAARLVMLEAERDWQTRG